MPPRRRKTGFKTGNKRVTLSRGSAVTKRRPIPTYDILYKKPTQRQFTVNWSCLSATITIADTESSAVWVTRLGFNPASRGSGDLADVGGSTFANVSAAYRQFRLKRFEAEFIPMVSDTFSGMIHMGFDRTANGPTSGQTAAYVMSLDGSKMSSARIPCKVVWTPRSGAEREWKVSSWSAASTVDESIVGQFHAFSEMGSASSGVTTLGKFRFSFTIDFEGPHS